MPVEQKETRIYSLSVADDDLSLTCIICFGPSNEGLAFLAHYGKETLEVTGHPIVSTLCFTRTHSWTSYQAPYTYALMFSALQVDQVDTGRKSRRNGLDC